jgi:hypothetical protein
MKLLIMHFSPNSCHFILLWPKYQEGWSDRRLDKTALWGAS